MHHGSHDEAERMGAEFQRVPFLDSEGVKRLSLKELSQEDQGLGRRHDPNVGILPCQCQDASGMVRFHVMDNQIIRFPAAEGLFQPFEPLFPLPGIDRIHHGHFFVQDEVGIIGHSLGNNVLAFEQIEVQVVHSDVPDVGTDILVHNCILILTNIERFPANIKPPPIAGGIEKNFVY